MGYPHGTFGWADVAVRDTEQAKHFYGELFGWTALETPGGDAVERARSLGATIQREPWDTSFGRMAVITDPQGPSFGIVEPPQDR